MLPSRRDLLALALRAAALPGAGEFFTVWLSAAEEHNHSSPPLLRDYQPKFFSTDDFRALQLFTEILIPTDESAGAREAHCAHYIDFVLQAAVEHAPDMLRQWRSAMASLEAAGFHSADSERRLILMAEISKPERDRTATHPAYAAYQLIKQQNTFAFYTARAGMIDTPEYPGSSFNAGFPACDRTEYRIV